MARAATTTDAFNAVAEPQRRRILTLLKGRERSVNELAGALRVSQSRVSKHLRVLRESGFVTSRVDAQRRVYAIEPGPLAEIDAWIARFRPFWTTKLDELGSLLEKE